MAWSCAHGRQKHHHPAIDGRKTPRGPNPHKLSRENRQNKGEMPSEDCVPEPIPKPRPVFTSKPPNPIRLLPRHLQTQTSQGYQRGCMAPATASPSAAWFPGSLLCPLTQVNCVGTPRASRSLSSARIAWTRSLFLTGPSLVIHPFRCQFIYHSVTHEIEYLLSVRISSGELRSIISSVRRMAVSSARWLVCSLPWSRSEMFLFFLVSNSAWRCSDERTWGRWGRNRRPRQPWRPPFRCRGSSHPCRRREP